MSRMSREFTLVLLGSGILTAGYFAAPNPAEEIAAKADDHASQRVHGSTYRHGHSSIYPLLFLHGMAYSGGRTSGSRPSASYAGVSRGGLGATGRSVSVSS